MSRSFAGFLRSIALALYQHDAVTIASAMAFSFFLSLVPLLLLAGYVLGIVVRAQGLRSVLQPLLDATPESARPLLEGELGALGSTTATLAPLVALGFVWASSSGVHGLLDGLEWVERGERRPWWRKRVIAIACTLLGIIVLAVLAWLSALLSVVLPAGLHKAATTAVLLVLGTAVLAGFYRYAVVKHRIAERHWWPGAFVAIASWTAVSFAFGAYVRSLDTYSMYYGGLAAVATLLLWCWISAMALLVGAEVNARLERPSIPNHDRERQR